MLHINTFVRRQTADSEYSHYTGTDEDLLALIETNLKKARPGYRAGVILVPVDPEGFLSGICQLEDGDKLTGEFKPRREGETPRKSITAVGREKMPAKSVEIVLYASTVLAEDGDNELPDIQGNWEIISINASPEEGEMPIDPYTLMFNHFGCDGGTATNLSDSEFVAMLREGFLWWKDKAKCG